MVVCVCVLGWLVDAYALESFEGPSPKPCEAPLRIFHMGHIGFVIFIYQQKRIKKKKLIANTRGDYLPIGPSSNSALFDQVSTSIHASYTK